jgi:hypothetical protein
MNRGKLLASGTAEQVRQILGSTERTITATLLTRHEEARAWLASQPNVHDPVADAPTVTFRVLGDDNAQADLMEGLIHLGIIAKVGAKQFSRFQGGVGGKF